MFILKICLNKQKILSKKLSCFENGKCNSNGVTSFTYDYGEERYFLSNNKETLIKLQDKYKKRRGYEESEILDLNNIEDRKSVV